MASVINEFSGEEIKLKNEYRPGSSITPIPVSMEFDNEVHDIYNQPLPQNMPGKSQEKPGLLETFAGKFTEQEELLQLNQWVDRQKADSNPLDDFVPLNWSPTEDKSSFIGVDKRNMGYILDATGPKDQRRRYNYVLDKQEHDERVSNGNILMQLAGGFTGAVVSPSSLIPIAKAVKFARASQLFLQNMPKMVGGIAVASASHEAVLETSKIGGNLSDWVTNTMIDTVIGTAFMGAHLGINYAKEAWNLYNARSAIKMMNDGIDARPVINEKGIVEGFRATPMDSSVGAAEVDMAQVYLDAAISKSTFHSIPYIGDKVGEALGKAGSYTSGFISPKIRMMNSRFPSIRALANAFAEHSFITKGIEAGRAVQAPFETMMKVLKGTNKTLKTTYDGFYMNRNGIEWNNNKTGERQLTNMKDLTEKYFRDGRISRDDFGREVQYALIEETPSEHAAVNNAAEYLRKNMDPLYLEYLKLYGISDKILRRKTSNGYLSRVYNVARMETNEREFIQDVALELQNDDAIIQGLLEPVRLNAERVRNAQEQHDLLIRNKSATDEQIASSSANLADLKRAHSASENELQNHLRENEELDRLIDDIHAVSHNEAQQIKTILKPLDNIRKKLEEQKLNVTRAKAERSSNKELSHTARTSETAGKRARLKDMSEKDVVIEERKLKDIQDEYDLEIERLQEQMHNREIPEELYFRIPNSNRYELKDPANRLKLRDMYESDFSRQTAAKGYYDSILNQTAEDNINSIMKKRMGEDKTNPLVKRTLLLRDKFLYDKNWLHPDPAINVMNYRNTLGRKNAQKIILNRLTVNGTFEELIERFGKEHEQAKQDLIKPLDAIDRKISRLKENENLTDTDKEKIKSLEAGRNKIKAEYDKKVRKLGKNYAKNKRDMEETIALMQGKNSGSKRAREYSKMANLYAVATKLGFLPFTMSTDLMANVFKHGFWPTIRDGLLPMLKTLGGLLNTAEGEAIRLNAAHAHLADMHVNHAYTDKNWTGTSQTYEPVQGKLATGLETLAHYSQNFSMANYVENFNQRNTAAILNIKIMRAMQQFTEGKLKVGDRDYQDLLKYGLDPVEFAERFMNGFKEGGEKGLMESKLAHYWSWSDVEASNKMSEAILRGVSDTIIRKGLLDAPFALNNPLLNSLFLFKGYTLATLTRFLAPLMQRPDAQKLIGTMLMMTVGSTQNPLRRLVAGKDPTEEDEHMFRNAVRDGGVFSILGDGYEEMNFITHGLINEQFGGVQNERYFNRTEMGVFNGPIGGMANDLTKIIGMVGSSELNQSDLRRMASNTPFLYSWQLRALVNKWIENTELPENRNKAHKLKEAS